MNIYSSYDGDYFFVQSSIHLPYTNGTLHGGLNTVILSHDYFFKAVSVGGEGLASRLCISYMVTIPGPISVLT